LIDIVASKAIPIEDVALRLGLDVRHHKIRCISKDHRDNRPSLSLGGQHNRFKCWSCGLSGDPLDLISIVLGIPMREAYDWLMGDTSLPAAMPIPIRDWQRVPRLGNQRLLADIWATCSPDGDWLAHKGLNAGRFGVRLMTEEAHNLLPEFPAGGLFIPYYQHGKITSARWRNLSPLGPKHLSLPGIDPILYNQDSLATLTGQPLWLTEGETDTMSAATLGHAAIGFPGATQYQLVERIQDWLPRLAVPKLILAFDNDAAGQRLDLKVRQKLADWPGQIETFDLEGHKDVNEWYQDGLR
jgi:DNA primase